MVFNRLTFAVFFLVVYGLYLVTQGRLRVQNALLLATSYVFYGWWDWRFLRLLGVSTLGDYLCARWLDRRGSTSVGIDPPGPYRYGPRTRKAVLIVSLVRNLGRLGVF